MTQRYSVALVVPFVVRVGADRSHCTRWSPATSLPGDALRTVHEVANHQHPLHGILREGRRRLNAGRWIRHQTRTSCGGGR